MNRFEIVIATVLAHESDDPDDIAAVSDVGDEVTRRAAHDVMVIRATREGRRMEVQS